MAGGEDQRLAEMAGALSTMKQEVDALQIAAQHDHKPWYRDGTVFVAALALVFSLGTTAVSYVKGEQQLREAERRDLRDLTMKLGTMPRELFEFQQKYGNNQQALSAFSGLLNAEQQILAKQASEIILRIPELVSASEHLYVANALISSNLPQIADWHVRAAVDKAKDADEIVVAYRTLANLAFLRGDAEDGRRQYELAKSSLSSGRVPVMNSTYVAWSNALTDIRWAQAEALAAHCVEFKGRLNAAMEDLVGLSDVVTSGPHAEITSVLAQGCPPHVTPEQPAVVAPPAGAPPRALDAAAGSLR